jgi:hypothetical protein
MKSAILSLFSVLTLSSATAFAAPIYQTIGGVPANNLCDAGNTFKTLKPVKTCVQWQETPAVRRGEYEVPAEWTCVASRMEQQVISKDITVCTKIDTTEAGRGCLETAKSTQSSTVLVWEKNPHYKDTFDYSNYTIPACQ